MTKTIEIKGIEEVRKDEYRETGARDLVIKPMTTWQFLQATKTLKETIDTLTADANISGALSGIFDGIDSDDSSQELISKLGGQFIKDAAGSIGLLLEVAPESAASLVATMAGINEYELNFQSPMVFFDILDAVVEENDIPAVIERVKLSYKKLGQAMGWMKVVTEATAPKVIK